MLAYLFWHRPAEGVDHDAYEHAAERLHRSLRRSPPAGLCGSALCRADELPWLGPAGTVGYEDWYLLEDFAAMGVLNEAALARGHRGAHHAVAGLCGSGIGGVYRLLEGRPAFEGTLGAVWVTPRAGAGEALPADMLGDGMDPQHASLWRRQLVLGPAPEYCLLGREPPAGVAASRLPAGWMAACSSREVIFGG